MKIGIILETLLNQSKNAETFLLNYAGVYQYRPLFRKAVFSFGVLCLLGVSIGVYDLPSDDQNSIYETIEKYAILVLGTYFVWSCFVFSLGFREIVVNKEGIRIFPSGIHLPPSDIEEIWRGNNFAGAGTIELKLKSPRFIFHVFAWSWGRKLTIAFNNRLLTQVRVPT